MVASSGTCHCYPGSGIILLCTSICSPVFTLLIVVILFVVCCPLFCCYLALWTNVFRIARYQDFLLKQKLLFCFQVSDCHMLVLTVLVQFYDLSLGFLIQSHETGTPVLLSKFPIIISFQPSFWQFGPN